MSSPDRLASWREVAGPDGTPLPTRDGPSEGWDIAFDDTPRPRRPPSPAETPLDGVQSIARLIAETSASGDLDGFKRAVRALPTTDTQTLILRVATTSDALKLWAIHVHLDKRGIPPVQRWPANKDTPQGKFITALADLLWFAKRNPTHTPLFKAWKKLWELVPGSPAWLEKAYWILANMASSNLARHGAKALALTLEQRQELMMFPTTAMVVKRRELQTSAFAGIRELLLTHAVAHPDKSGTHTPEAVARRRARLWRAHILSGCSTTATAKTWELLTGESLTRQAISKALTITGMVLRESRVERST